MTPRKKATLSEPMLEALEGARRGNGTLVREHGGYWTFPGCGHASGTPDWYVNTTTVNALIARDVVRVIERKQGRSHEFPICVEIIVQPTTPGEAHA